MIGLAWDDIGYRKQLLRKSIVLQLNSFGRRGRALAAKICTATCLVVDVKAAVCNMVDGIDSDRYVGTGQHCEVLCASDARPRDKKSEHVVELRTHIFAILFRSKHELERHGAFCRRKIELNVGAVKQVAAPRYLRQITVKRGVAKAPIGVVLVIWAGRNIDIAGAYDDTSIKTDISRSIGKSADLRGNARKGHIVHIETISINQHVGNQTFGTLAVLHLEYCRARGVQQVFLPSVRLRAAFAFDRKEHREGDCLMRVVHVHRQGETFCRRSKTHGIRPVGSLYKLLLPTNLRRGWCERKHSLLPLHRAVGKHGISVAGGQAAQINVGFARDNVQWRTHFGTHELDDGVLLGKKILCKKQGGNNHQD